MDKFKIISIKNINDLPTTAGVYAFYTKSGKRSELLPIYIGKAINIKNRTKNHFSSPTYKDNIFISQITNIGFIETGTRPEGRGSPTEAAEIQALILEANLIKKNQPKFNQIWRDDKNYFFIAIAQNKLGIPYIFITHQPRFAKASQGKPNSLDPRPYTLNPKYIGPFVEGNALKKTIRFLRKIFPYYTNSKHSKLKCTYCHLDLCPGPYFVPLSGTSQGKPNPDLVYYKKNIKKLILVLEGKSKTVLNSLKKEMRLTSEKQDFEKAVKIRNQIFALEKIMSHKNSQYSIIQRPLSNGVWEQTEIYLQKILNFKKSIKKIECYDVSNIQGKFATASMVVFTNGLPDKNQYKKFRIHMKNEPNDIAMLKETLQRRFAHPEWEYPEIILIDGGISQLNAGIKSKFQNPNSKQTKEIKIISIAKGRQELFIENPSTSLRASNPIPLKNLPQEIYNLIKNLDDEAHRFAITYHKKLRRQNLLK